MDDVANSGFYYTVYDQKIKGCPVKVGDRFYYNNHGTKDGTICEDYIIVMEIKELGDREFAIRGRYENRLIGPFERWFSSKIFEDSNWVIKKK